jgi:acyl carrier protein
MLWQEWASGRQVQPKARPTYRLQGNSSDRRRLVMVTKQQIKDILVKLLKVRPEELKDAVSLQDSIGVDSTEMVETVIALEKAFGTKISPKEVTKFSTISDIEQVVNAKLSAK